MELILKHLKKFGIREVVANTHYLAEKIQDKFKNNNLGIDFNFVHEMELSGTAGGVKKCQWFFEPGETFVIVSGDALTDVNLSNLIKKHLSTGAIATMALKKVPLSEVSHFGVVVVDESGKVTEFQEKPSPDKAKSNYVNTGIYVFNYEIFKYIPDNTFYDFAKNVFPAIMESDESLYAHVIDEYWSDIGTINQYRLSSYDIVTSKISIDPPYKKTETGFHADSAKISSKAVLSGTSVVGENTVIEDQVRLFGNCIIGNNCVIKEGTHIRNAIIWDGVVVEPGAKLDGCIIAENVIIGQKSIITPGSVVPKTGR